MALRVWLVAVLALLSASALSADFESGCAAFERGDYEAAREAWEPLAEQGHAQARFRLGCLYAFGQGVPEDLAMALRLYRLAAEQGDPDAQNNLGGMYAEGMGVEPDLVQAYMWFEIAAATGHAMAMSNRAFVAAAMDADEIAKAEALAKDWRARHQ
jgi:TPR repeat protein